MSNGRVTFLTETLVIEAILADPKMLKNASGISDILSAVEEYFKSKIDKNHTTASVLSELAPGVLWLTLSSLGFGKIGLALGFIAQQYHVDVKEFISSMYEKVKEIITTDHKISEGQIDQIVAGTVQQFSSQPKTSSKIYSPLELLGYAKLINVALVNYEKQIMKLTKVEPDYSQYKIIKNAQAISLLGLILGWIFKVILRAGGLLLIAEMGRKLFDYKDSATGSQSATSEPVQTKYHFKSDAPLPTSLRIVNTPENIDNQIIEFAKNVYDGLDGKENLIRNTPGFQAIKSRIIWWNEAHPGSSIVSIPPEFTTQKQLVNYFIDDVAKKDI